MVRRVLHVLGSMNRGGQETFIMNVYRNIDREKIQFNFLINAVEKCDFEDEIISMGGVIHRIPRRYPNYILHIRRLNEFFENNKQYEVIHQHTCSNTAVSTIIYAKKHGAKKIIYHCHNSKADDGIISKVFDSYYKPRLRKYSNHFFACSQPAAQNLFGNYIANAEIRIIPNAIDLEFFVFDPSVRKEKRKELGIEEKYVIGHIGRFDTQKNHRLIIDIFNEIYKKSNNSILLLVGDGELRDDIEKKAEQLGLKESVIFTGVRSDVPGLLSAMDVFLFPSLWEGLGIALIEAQANGLHCIVSDVVPDEAKVTELIEYVPLSEPAVNWAEKALVYGKGYVRKDTREDIKAAGYDIMELSKWLENFYHEQ